MAHKNLSPIRTQKELSAFLSFLDKTIQDDLPRLATASKRRVYNKEWVDAIELENMLHLLKCATISALHRAESRGVHFREDFPYTDNDNWLKENIIRYENGALEIYRRPVTITSMTPPKGRVPYLDMIKKMMESRSDVGDTTKSGEQEQSKENTEKERGLSLTLLPLHVKLFLGGSDEQIERVRHTGRQPVDRPAFPSGTI
jgi:hypothetical protein